jgi:hypothetical protein
MLTSKDVAAEWCRLRMKSFVRVADGSLRSDRHCTDYARSREYSCIRYGSSVSREKSSAALGAELRERERERDTLRILVRHVPPAANWARFLPVQGLTAIHI